MVLSTKDTGMTKRRYTPTFIAAALALVLALTFAAFATEQEGEHRGGRSFGPPPARDLSPEQIEEAVEVIREISPWLGDRLDKARAEDTQRFKDFVARLYPKFARFMELRRHDPELYKLRITEAQLDSRSRRLAWKVLDAEQNDDAGQAAELRQQLQGVLAELLDIRQQARQLEIDRLKKKLAELEVTLADQQQRQQLIQQRFEELLDQMKRFRARHHQPEGENRGPDHRENTGSEDAGADNPPADQRRRG